MKMFKKLLAVTLAGVMALCVLTGCSGGSSAPTIVEAMKSADTKGYTINTNEKLDERVNTLAEDLNGQYRAARDKDKSLTLKEYVQSQEKMHVSAYKEAFAKMGDVVEVSIIKVNATSVNTQARNLWDGMTKIDPEEDVTIDTAKPTYLSVSKVVFVNGSTYRIAIFIATKTQG